MTSTDEHIHEQNQNTPRTRNNLRDNTARRKSPEGYTRGDWTFRKQLEADFRALGFKSHKFSHKNEPEDRLADSLWLSWNSDNKGLPPHQSTRDIEVRVVFIEHKTPYYIDHEFIYTVTHKAMTRGGCYARTMGKATFKENFSDGADVLAYVKYLITKDRIS